MSLLVYDDRKKVILDFLEDILIGREDREKMFANMQHRIQELTEENRDLKERLKKLKKE